MIELYATIKKSGPPTKNTPGAVGQIYVDTDTGLRWECVEAHREKHYKGTQEFYDWEERGLDPDFVVGGLEEAESKISLPVKLNVLKTICKNGQIAGTNDKYTFFRECKLNEGDLYLLDYRYYVNGVEDPANRICAVSSVINDTVCWGSNDSANNITMTKNWVTDTWRPKDNNHKSVINIYQVEKVVEDDSKYHVMTLEGRDCIASGLHAHAEGGATLASGMYSHAEGTNAVASGDHSHAEGFNTEAAGPKQHVEGMYNVIDKKGKYAHIVGNGLDGSSRSNAYTLDWQGNARFAGDVYAGDAVLDHKPQGVTKVLDASEWTQTNDGYVYPLTNVMDTHLTTVFPLSSTIDKYIEAGIETYIADYNNLDKWIWCKAKTLPTKDIAVAVVRENIEFDLSETMDLLVFKSYSPFSISVDNPGWDGTIEYLNVDFLGAMPLEEWKVWTGSKIDSVNFGPQYIIIMRGKNNYITNNNLKHKWTITGSNVECSGNIMSLIDWELVGLYSATGIYKTGCFAYMFSNCAALTTAPKLPATKLYTNCYACMFENCTNLTTAPELPATTLAYGCYQYMFNGCTGLTTAPELPATTLANSCYSGMFNGCTGLTTAPELPATTLVNSCYSGMFAMCYSLTAIPELPATTLADSCYVRMFDECRSIKLSATQTDEYTQAYRIPTTGAGMTATSAFVNMLVGTGGTFTDNPTINTTYYLHKDCTIIPNGAPV